MKVGDMDKIPAWKCYHNHNISTYIYEKSIEKLLI